MNSPQQSNNKPIRRRRMLRTLAGRRRFWVLRKPDRGGFTLTEIMVVMVILVIGIMPLAMVQNQSRREVTKADRFTQAITLAQEQLEQMKGLGFGNAVPDTGIVGQITWSSNVTVVSFGLERIDVTVDWQDEDGPKTVTLADMVSVR